MKKVIVGFLLLIASLRTANASQVYECVSDVVVKNLKGEVISGPKKMASVVINKDNSFILKNSGGALMSGILQYTGEKSKDGSAMYGSQQFIGTTEVVMMRTEYRDTLAWFAFLKNDKTITNVLTLEADCTQR